MEFEAVPLHKHKEHFDECANLLNAEWPRSKAAREYSLNKSCDDMPCSLVFRRRDTHEVVGHSRIVSVQGKDRGCLIESVIIRKDMRGTGLGRKLMTATEAHALNLGCQTAFLNTVDEQGFYARLGYTKCGPVTSLGANANRVPEDMLLRMLGMGDIKLDKQDNTSGKSEDRKSDENSPSEKAASALSVAHPQLLQTLPPPPPPPPPPPVPASARAEAIPQSHHVIRMNPNSVIWMQKSLQ